MGEMTQCELETDDHLDEQTRTYTITVKNLPDDLDGERMLCMAILAAHSHIEHVLNAASSMKEDMPLHYLLPKMTEFFKMGTLYTKDRDNQNEDKH